MRTLYTNGKLARNGILTNEDMLVDEGVIMKIASNIPVEADMEVVDLGGEIVLPKLFDEHTHGSFGVDFNLATLDEMKKVIEYYKEQNVGTVFPTLLTDEDEVMERQIKLICELSEIYPEVKGIHLEGPFLSPQYKGAMPEHLLQKPNIETLAKFVEISDGLVKLMTMSPELEGAPEFIREAVKLGVKINLGHSGATYAEALACIEAGADGFTHVGNAMRPIHQHEIGVLGAALLSDCYNENILDGLHLADTTVQFFTKAKGIDKIVGITDSIMAAGLPDGFYKLGVNDVVVKNGDARLVEGDVRAGSTLKATDALRNYAKFIGLPIEKAVQVLSENPAKRMGMFDVTGSLDEGKLAEFFVFQG